MGTQNSSTKGLKQGERKGRRLESSINTKKKLARKGSWDPRTRKNTCSESKDKDTGISNKGKREYQRGMRRDDGANGRRTPRFGFQNDYHGRVGT